jgi:hypothetical protein
LNFKLGISNLLQALPRQLQLAIRCLLRFLDKRVQHNYALADQKTVKRTTNTATPLWAQLEQAVAEGARMRKAKTGAMLRKQLNKPCVVSQNIDRPRLDLMEDSIVKAMIEC